MGTLYVASMPVGDLDDITFRAIRMLREAALVLTTDLPRAQRLFNHHGVTTPLIDSTGEGDFLAALAVEDVVVLSEGWLPAPSVSVRVLIQLALKRGSPVVPLPGPSLPVTALAVSGLPADSFVYLGVLPQEPDALTELLASVAGERRTLVALESPNRRPHLRAELHGALGDRPLALVTLTELGTEVIERRWPSEAHVPVLDEPGQGPCVLVIGGAREQATRWNEDRLRMETQACLDRGLGAREASRQLAIESGWPRREIYRLATQAIRLACEAQ